MHMQVPVSTNTAKKRKRRIDRRKSNNVKDPGRHIQKSHAKKKKKNNESTRHMPRFIGSASASVFASP
jgi:hypothetical protein